jgi:hypothetical protein
MRVFRTGLLCHLLDGFHQEEAAVLVQKLSGEGALPIPGERLERIRQLLRQGRALFQQDHLDSCLTAVRQAEFYITRERSDASAAAIALNRLKGDIIKALVDREFISVADDRRGYLDQERGFGDAVFFAFPSAGEEITATGNCLAAECPTAAVFHAMRVAEIGLRALAFDRRVQVFKNKATLFEIPLELATWDQIIKELEDAEKAIQGFPQTLAREEQFKFYHGALMQFRRFKNVFRNGLMHMRESYDRDQAFSAVKQVREFMEILASRIKEGEQTPVIWV